MPRANWHLDVPVDDSDPWAVPAAAVAERVDLSDRDRLHAHLLDLMLREGQLAHRGITCSLKERDDSCCSACPLFGKVADIRDLCTVGRDQERTMMTMLAESV